MTAQAATHCAECGERCEERAISLALPRAESGLAVVKNVPAEVCPACGETRFSLRTTGRLMALFRRNDPPEDVVLVPIYNLESL